MRRGLWFVAGAGVGVYAMVRGRRAAEALTAEGLHDRWQALGAGARLFRDEVATGKAEAEARLRERFGPTYDTTPRLTGGTTAEIGSSNESNSKQEGPQ
jgi:hypothetical protein